MSLDAVNAQRATGAYLDTLNRSQTTTTGGVNATSAPTPTDADGDATKTTAPGAVIALSPGAQFFAQVLAAAQGASDVRADKMAAVQARLAANPDGGADMQALAAKLLGSDAL
jgi:hypothetical protein